MKRKSSGTMKDPSKRKVVSSVDRISNLPDSLLSHILSFIPSTKQVVATTILSKRWHNVWTYVDNLYLDNSKKVHPSDGVAGKMQFAEFVHEVLQLHRAPRIKNMRLYCHERGCNEHDITTWLTTAIARNVESLDLLLKVKFDLPFFHFNSPTLTNLKIDSTIFHVNIHRPPCLPSLKKLHLKTRSRSRDWSHTFSTFISGCSALESLHLEASRCNHYSYETFVFKISSATLQKIYLGCYMGFDKIVLDTPALKSLCIHNAFIKEFVVESDLPYLYDAYIKSVHQNFARFVQSLSNAKVLQLHLFSIKEPVKCDLNARFCNLTILTISSYLLELNLLKSLMENSNNLQDVCLEKICDRGKNEIGWVEPREVPRCLMVSLKKMTIKGIDRLDQLDIVEYVLKNGKVLEMIEIHSASSINVDWKLKFQMLQKITMFGKASESCKPAFY